MAKEKVQLDAKTAKSIGRQLVDRLEEYGIAERDLVHGGDFDKSWDARKELKNIVEKVDKLVSYREEPKAGWEDAVAELRGWILANLTDAGWKRLQATRRKADHARNNRAGKFEERLMQMRTTIMGAHLLKGIADEYELDRSDLVDKLAHWLTYEDSGKAAVKRFAAEKRLKAKPKDEAGTSA